jgi:hypothetical protein
LSQKKQASKGVLFFGVTGALKLLCWLKPSSLQAKHCALSTLAQAVETVEREDREMLRHHSRCI